MQSVLSATPHRSNQSNFEPSSSSSQMTLLPSKIRIPPSILPPPFTLQLSPILPNLSSSPDPLSTSSLLPSTQLSTEFVIDSSDSSQTTADMIEPNQSVKEINDEVMQPLETISRSNTVLTQSVPSICPSPTGDFTFPEPHLPKPSADESEINAVRIEPYSSPLAHPPSHMSDSISIGPESIPASENSSPNLTSASSSRSTPQFHSSTFLMDAVASPSPNSFQDHMPFDFSTISERDIQWSQERSNHSENESNSNSDSEFDEDGEANEDGIDVDDGSDESPVQSVGSIGDVSMDLQSSTNPSSSLHLFAHPIILQEDLAGVMMHDIDPSKKSDRSSLRRKKPPSIATDKLWIPSTPVTRRKRLEVRRNSATIIMNNHMTRHRSENISQEAHPPSNHSHSLRLSQPHSPRHDMNTRSLKRKCIDTDETMADGVCIQCQSCVECAHHWDVVSDIKPHPRHDHGHIHSKSSLPSSPTAHSRLDHSTLAPMLISPKHHVAPNKPNYAIRSGISLDDSPNHTSMALGPPCASRRLHHRMIHGHAYEVAQLIDVRAKNGAIFYKVRWKGFPDLYQSWEPSANIEQNCQSLIESFEEENGKVESDGYDTDNPHDSSTQSSLTDVVDDTIHPAVADLHRASLDFHDSADDEAAIALLTSDSPKLPVMTKTHAVTELSSHLSKRALATSQRLLTMQ